MHVWERARNAGWVANLKQADCRRTARLIIEIPLERVGEIEAERRFFKPSKGESGRMVEWTEDCQDEHVTCRQPH